MKSAAAIAFDCRPSPGLIAALAVVWLLAMVALFASAVPFAVALAGGAAASPYAAFALRRALMPSVVRCAWHADGQWRVRDRDGFEHAATLRHASVRGPLIVLLLLAGPLRKVAIILLPDNSDADVRRRLRVRLSRADALALPAA
jgi:toxin CptA